MSFSTFDLRILRMYFGNFHLLVQVDDSFSRYLIISRLTQQKFLNGITDGFLSTVQVFWEFCVFMNRWFGIRIFRKMWFSDSFCRYLPISTQVDSAKILNSNLCQTWLGNIRRTSINILLRDLTLKLMGHGHIHLRSRPEFCHFYSNNLWKHFCGPRKRFVK